MVDYSPSSPSGATTSYGYDASSNLTSVTQSNNMSISYAYNTNNEVNCIGYPIPGTSTAGACANAPSPANPVVLRHHNADGQLVSVEDFFGPPGMNVGRFRDLGPGAVHAAGRARWVRG